MAFEGLTEKLQGAFKKLNSKGKLTEADVKTAMREVRMALLEADVNFLVVKDFVKKVTERAVGADIMAVSYLMGAATASGSTSSMFICLAFAASTAQPSVNR